MNWFKGNQMYERNIRLRLSGFYFSWHQIAGCPAVQLSFVTNQHSSCRLHGLRAQFHKISNTICMYFWLAGQEFSDSLNSLVRFDAVLEQLVELRKTLDLQLQAYYKGCSAGPVQWKRGVGKECGDRRGVSLPSCHWQVSPGGTATPGWEPLCWRTILVNLFYFYFF